MVLATLRLQGCCHMVHCRVFDESLLGVGATIDSDGDCEPDLCYLLISLTLNRLTVNQ